MRGSPFSRERVLRRRETQRMVRERWKSDSERESEERVRVGDVLFMMGGRGRWGAFLIG